MKMIKYENEKMKNGKNMKTRKYENEFMKFIRISWLAAA